jgi:hypothetical protein
MFISISIAFVFTVTHLHDYDYSLQLQLQLQRMTEATYSRPPMQQCISRLDKFGIDALKAEELRKLVYPK